MKNKKIKAIAKIERDAKNFFFVKMLYGFEESQRKPQTIFEMKDVEVYDSLVILSRKALSNFQCCSSFTGDRIIVYNPEGKYSQPAFQSYAHNNPIIIGTEPSNSFRDINYLARMLDYTMNEEKIGEFFVQYKEQIMRIEAFYEFQKNLSILKG